MRNRQTIIDGAAFQMERAADCIVQKYEADGYQAQKLSFNSGDDSGMLVQIRNTSGGVGGFLKTVTGCKICATLTLLRQGSDLSIEVTGGRWLDKAVVIAMSPVSILPLAPLIPLIPLLLALPFIFMITGITGIYKQQQLLNKVFLDTLGFFAGSK